MGAPDGKEQDMAWIRWIPPQEATGELNRLYEESVRRAGKVFHIVRVQSLRPAMLRAGIGLYAATTLSPGELTRAQKEMLAVVVSAANRCRY